MSTEHERAFEKWWEDEDLDKKLSNIQGVMFNRIKKLASNAWTEAWDQSRASVALELPEMLDYGLIDEKETKSALRAAGITVKE